MADNDQTNRMTKEPVMLRMGFGAVDTTPALGLRMAGSPPYPVGEAVHGPLMGKVILADDGERRVAIVCLDLMNMLAPEATMLRDRLAEIGGLAPEAIMVACSHTHCAPFTFLGNGAIEPDVFAYLDDLRSRVELAMAAAVADLRPVTLTAGRIQAPGWVFNRRPIYTGDQVATHGRSADPRFVRFEGTPDEELQILTARDESGNVAGGLVSFACHPTVMMGLPIYSSDYPGLLTSRLEARYGGTFGFVLGASGDSANVNPADPSDTLRQGLDHLLAMGTALSAHAEKAMSHGHASESSRVGYASTILRLPQRRPAPEQAALARWYLEEAPSDLDEQAFTRRFTGNDYVFWSEGPRARERQARELLDVWNRQRWEGTRDLFDEVEVQALRIGDTAIVAAPVEFFTATGRELKTRSPFAGTFIASMANGWSGYLPTADAFARGGYETFLSYQSRLPPDAADRITEAALSLLAELAS